MRVLKVLFIAIYGFAIGGDTIEFLVSLFNENFILGPEKYVYKVE